MESYNIRLERLLRKDRRYKPEAYSFVRESLAFAQKVLDMGRSEDNPGDESHLTGQELCEAIRIHALDQFGYMALVVLRSWGLRTTNDLGEIVYNLIGIGVMNQSESDRREDFDSVYDFEQAFRKEFRITIPD